MVLYAEHASVSVFGALHGSVKKIDMSCTESRTLKAARIHRIAVVLRGYFRFAGKQIPYRVISAPVPEFKLICPCSAGERYELMSEAYSEHGIFAAQRLYQFYTFTAVGSVSGSVGLEFAVGLHFFFFFCGHIVRHCRDVAAAGVKRPYYSVLYTAVHRHDGISCKSRA